MAQVRNIISDFCASSLLVVLIGILLLRPEQLLAQAVAVTGFDLGETSIEQKQFEPDSRFYTMPVMLQGVLAVPEGTGHFPVALVVHGSYQFCDAIPTGDDEVDVYPCPPENDLRQFEGFSYLAEALAAHGISPSFLIYLPNSTMGLVRWHRAFVARRSSLPI